MKLLQTLSRSIALLGCALVIVLGLSACGGGSSSGASYSIGGTLSGLGDGKSVVLQNNGGDDLSLSTNGGFIFATALGGGNVYDVTVLTQPVNQTCTVSNGIGTLFGLNVTDVAVTCVTVSRSIGGSVSGLDSGKSVVLQNNGGDDLTISANGGFVFPTAELSGSTYYVTVLTPPSEQSCTVDNGSGTVSGADISDVAVVCRTWNGAALIEHDDAGDASDPQVVADGNGNAVAVWAQADGSSITHISANRYVAGSGWLTPIRIDSDNTNDAVSPQLAMDGSGNAMVVWAQAGSIWAKRYTAGVGWGAAMSISSGGTSVAAPQITVDTNGDAVAVWQQLDGTQNIWANHYLAGWGWGTATTISDGVGNATVPQVVADTSGNAVAVWAQFDGTRDNIMANRYLAGSGWGTAALIETDNSGTAANPQISVGADGNGMAVWQQSDGTRTNIWANHYSAGSGWDGAMLIEHDDTAGAIDPQVATDTSGNAVAVWTQSNSIWSARYTAGVGWNTATSIISGGTSVAAPQVAVDASGDAVAVWQQLDSTQNIWTSRYSPGSGWDGAMLIEHDDAGPATGPQVAVDSIGNAVAVWAQSDGTHTSIQANLYR
jgi:uncharacterized protein YheU (UPF0270 family)